MSSARGGRPFAKYEGLGNDFIVLDAEVWPEQDVGPALARALCDRHRAVGGDGVLWVRETGPGAARLVIFNADGTRPEMCGNGVRCVAAWLADRGRLSVGQTLALETDAGPRPVRIAEGADGAWRASVDMGALTVDPAPIATVASAAGPVEVFFADAGNPHAVLFTPVVDRAEAEGIAARVRALEARYPHGTNVEFVVETGAQGVVVRVHERGVGWTLACGTGACAVAAVRAARSSATRAVTEVTLDGGTLSIAVEREPDGRYRAVMTGPARRAFEGGVRVIESTPEGLRLG
jgi:diaminopimelate epimerase